MGGATVARLRTEGADVIAAGRDQEKLDALARETGARTLAFDVAEEGQVEKALDGLDQVMHTNAYSALLMTKHAARRMIAQGRGGAIVYVSSQARPVGLRGHIAYGSSKAAMDNNHEGLCSGARRARDPRERDQPDRGDDGDVGLVLGRPEIEGPYVDQMPLHRRAIEADIAGPLVFLLGDDAAMITGVCLPLDGGYTNR
nr:SDR family oxidoreductase [Brachybacterium endophyticum]